MAQQTSPIPDDNSPPLIEVVDDIGGGPGEAAAPAAGNAAATLTPEHPETINLAAHMDPQTLSALAQEVVDDYERDLQSRAGWDEQHELWARLYYQTDYANTSQSVEDRTWGATESMPILTEAANQFAARGRKTFFPSREFIDALVVSLGNDPTGGLDKELNAQTGLTKPAGFMDRFKALLGFGTPHNDDTAHMADLQESLEELRERAKRVSKHMNYQLTVEVKGYKEDKVALFLSTAVHGMMFTKCYPDFSTGKYVPKIDNVRGVDLVVPYMVGAKSIEELPRKTHRLFPTVLETEMMARSQFFTSACKPATNLEGKMSGEDKAAADAEGLTTGADTDGTLSRQAFVLECHRFFEIDDPANKTQKIIAPVIVWVDYEDRSVKRLAIRYETDENGNPSDNRKPVEYFTPYKYFPNPDGFYGYGLGQMVGNINVASNITYRQTSDASTLANDGNMSGFISNRIAGQDGEEVVLELGRFTPVPDNVGDISNGIFQFKFPGPNESQFKLLQLLMNYGNRLGGSTEAVTGTVDKVVQPTTLMTQLEQGLELPSSVMMGIAQSMGDEFQKIFRLNRLYMKEKIYFVVENEVQAVGPEDYAADLRIQPIFDAKMVVKAQRVALAQAELQATLQNPNNQGRPEVIDTAFRRYLEALEVDDIDELIPEPPQPQRFDDQNAENALFLMPQHPPFDVFPDQDHKQHLALIDEFMQTPFGTQLSPQAAQELQMHRQKHLAYLYAQQTKANLNAGQNPNQRAGLSQGPTQSAPFGGGQPPGGPTSFEPLAPALPGAPAGPAGPDMGAPAPAGGAAAGLG